MISGTSPATPLASTTTYGVSTPRSSFSSSTSAELQTAWVIFFCSRFWSMAEVASRKVKSVRMTRHKGGSAMAPAMSPRTRLSPGSTTKAFTKADVSRK